MVKVFFTFVVQLARGCKKEKSVRKDTWFEGGLPTYSENCSICLY